MSTKQNPEWLRPGDSRRESRYPKVVMLDIVGPGRQDCASFSALARRYRHGAANQNFGLLPELVEIWFPLFQERLRTLLELGAAMQAVEHLNTMHDTAVKQIRSVIERDFCDP